MDAAMFGPFLKELRKERKMTQSQLAEMLHISVAAVSKWERGKSLPDVAKLEDIAKALDVNILEIMQCKISEQTLQKQELAQVYTETLQAANRQQRHRNIRCLAATLMLLGVVAIGTLLYYFPIYRIAWVWFPSYFDTGEISMLSYIGSQEDREIAKDILLIAEEAASDLGLNSDEAKEKYGLLSRFVPLASSGTIVSENHSIRLWSARFHQTDGYMWVYYSLESLDAKGNVISGSWRIPSLWYLEKDDAGNWYVQHIKEHP